MRHRALVAALAAAAFAAPASAQLMIPDSGAGDRIMLFSQADGSLIDLNWITDIGAFGWEFSTPKEAIVVNNEIWVADQVTDDIHRFELEDRNYIGSISFMSTGSALDNVRGLAFDGAAVYITNASPTANRGIASFAPDGTPLGFFPIPASLFDVEPFHGDLLISNDPTNSIERWTTSGVYLGAFATGVVFPQQVATMPDGSIIAVSSIANAGIEGVYHYNADGALRRFLDTQPQKVQVGEQVPRGAWLLDDGGYLIATSIGVFKAVEIAPDSYMFLTMADGVNAQYISAISSGGNPCPADWSGDGNVNSGDISAFLTDWIASVQAGSLVGDFDGSGQTNSGDISAFLTAWIDAVTNGC